MCQLKCFLYRYLEAGQVINCTIGIELEDGSVEWVDMPLAYITSWASDGRKVTFQACDKVATLTEKYTLGNYIHTRTLYDDALEILQYLGFEPDEYIIDDVLRNVEIENPLPEVSCAECLQLIANAGRCALKQDVNGRICLIPNFENIVEPNEITVTSEGESEWSKPDNIRTGSIILYADLTRDFWSADGSMFLLPENGEEYLDTGFVSSEVADIDGNFETNPSVTLELPATYTYFGINCTFGGNPPQNMTISIYDNNDLLDEVEVEDITNDFHFNYDFYNFNKLKIEFTKASPFDRIVLQKVEFGNLTDYRLVRQDMKTNPVGVVEPKTRSVSVRIFTYEEVDGTPKQVDDNEYYTRVLGSVGEAVTFENPLISTVEHATQIATWLGNYYLNNITYSVNYRGEPRIEALDYIYMDSEILNNLQVEVESHTLVFNGALSGTLNLRRASNMINTNT